MRNMGDGRRVARVEKEVQSVVSTFVIQRLQSELPGLVTITRVLIPADLRTAKVFVSLLQTRQNEKGEISAEDLNKDTQQLQASVKILQTWAADIQHEIGKKLQMKYLPKLTFMPDESTEKILKIERIISTLHQPGSKMSAQDLENIDDVDELEDDE